MSELTRLATTSGREQQATVWVERWAGRRSGLKLHRDRAGNLIIASTARRRRAPLVVVAHLDHPGFEVEQVKGRRVVARFLGGVLPEYFPGAAVELFSGDPHPGRVDGYDPTTKTAEIRLARTVPGLAAGDIGRWRFSPARMGIKGGLLRAPACDDLAGVAACLATLDLARKEPELAHLVVLLTRAEEVGFLGAIAACRLRSISVDSRILSIETSRSYPDSPLGEGPIIRVGDASSVFDSDLTNTITAVARDSELMHQRKLMAGGSCEATAFGAYGYAATGLCLALENYHNMVDPDGVRAGTAIAKLAPEAISLVDFDGLIDLLVLVARRLDDDRPHPSEPLERLFRSKSELLRPESAQPVRA